MKIAVIVDRLTVPRWAAEALSMLQADEPVLVYNCLNTPPSRRRLRHAAYYLLNLFTIRNRMTRGVAVAGPLPRAEIVDFESEIEGAWQRLPDGLLDRIAADRPDAIVKFGMGLLRIPPPERLAVPVLSYHHGDPASYRGRPAGFWELLHGRQSMGQIVQILSNRLDAGAIAAFGESKVFAHSYRATLIDAFSRSPLLLKAAIANATTGVTIDRESAGKVYRLPGTTDVLRLLGRTMAARVRRLLYGAFIEKRWEVSSAAAREDDLLLADGGLPDRAGWSTLPCPKGYTFLADPFFAPAGPGLFVEALRATSGRGEILHIADGAAARISPPGGHYSYPASVSEQGSTFVVPEVALWSPPIVYEPGASGWRRVAMLDLPGDPRLLDPTFVRHEGRLYLFASLLHEGAGVLRLWHAPSLFERFEEHPASPVRVSPDGARMAGDILRQGGALLRLGQQWQEQYGEGVIVFRIDRLSPAAYAETALARIRFAGVKGPHTLNFRDGVAIFDWYRERFSPLAGLRRLAALSRGGSAPAATNPPVPTTRDRSGREPR